MSVMGSPEEISRGAAPLLTVSKNLHGMVKEVRQSAQNAADAAGDPVLADALSRFAAAYSTATTDAGEQFRLAHWLAQNVATDFTVAGSGAVAGSGTGQ